MKRNAAFWVQEDLQFRSHVEVAHGPMLNELAAHFIGFFFGSCKRGSGPLLPILDQALKFGIALHIGSGLDQGQRFRREAFALFQIFNHAC